MSNVLYEGKAMSNKRVNARNEPRVAPKELYTGKTITAGQ